MKRKHSATTAPMAAKAKQTAKAAPAAGRRPAAAQQFARPMRPLDDSDSDADAAEDPRSRSLRMQVDADNEMPEEELEEEEDEDSEDDGDAMDDGAEEEADAADRGDSAEDDDQAEDDEEEEADAAAAADDLEEDIPVERDFPVQLVQATYSGMLYGLKSRDSMRQLQSFQRKLHSKRGIDEADVSAEEEEEEEQTGATAATAASSAAKGAGGASSSSSSFSLLFTTSAHIGSIKSLAVSADGKWMVSGGLDESIKIFKTATMSEYGVLIHHAGSVSCLQFYGSGFLLSGGQEGSLIIWNTKDWSIAKKFEGAHRGVEGSGSAGGVSCIGVHPSGRVALSVGVADRQVKLWDLMKGNMASSRTVDTAFHTVQWSPNGEMYALVGEKRVDLYDTSNTLLRREEVSETKILSAVFLTADLFALGCEDKSIRVHSVHTGECLTTLQGHAARVRGLDCLSMPSSAAEDAPLDYFIGSASTDGQTHLWELTSLARAAAAAAPNAPATPATAFHPICSSAHDQRVVLLKFLPHWRVRKDNPTLLVPVQTKAAEQRQQELMAKKQSKRAAGGDDAAASAAPSSSVGSKGKAPLTKAERAAHTLQKSKALFERRAAALQKAKRTLAKNSPHAALADTAAEAQPRKKVKPSFEEAPQIDSDDEQPQPTTAHDEDDEEDAVPTKKAAAAPANSKPKLSAAQQAQSNKGQNKKTAAVAPAAQPKAQPKAQAKAQPKAKAAAAAAGSDSEDEEGGDSHKGFSAALPMFKPQLKLQIKKKKKSLAKAQRDAERSRKQR